jgi:hypothetical protein
MVLLKRHGRTLRILFGAEDVRQRFGYESSLHVHMHEDTVAAELQQAVLVTSAFGYVTSILAAISVLGKDLDCLNDRHLRGNLLRHIVPIAVVFILRHPGTSGECTKHSGAHIHHHRK